MKKAMCVVMLIIGIICTLLILPRARAEMWGKAPMIPTSGKALWEYLQKEDYAKKWKMWPGKKALYMGREPHGSLLTTYVNEPAYMAIEKKHGMLPEGSIVAKENYSADKKYMALTVLYKVKGYYSQGNDWFWAKYTPDGKIEAEGKPDMCIQCHSSQKSNDYIMTAPLK